MPIIITPDEEFLATVDGFHRLTKAKRLGLRVIPTKLIVLSPEYEK